jgi:ribosome-binding protein aMBF1 (putative translation factor)
MHTVYELEQQIRRLRSGRLRPRCMCCLAMPALKPPINATLAEFGVRVRARRVALGWSQEVAADHIGIHFTHLGQVERGQRSSRIENILKLAAGLQITPGELLDDLPLPTEND